MSTVKASMGRAYQYIVWLLAFLSVLILRLICGLLIRFIRLVLVLRAVRFVIVPGDNVLLLLELVLFCR